MLPNLISNNFHDLITIRL